MITILGASGYVGSNLLQKLSQAGIEVYTPVRGEILAKKNLGHIIYCIGMTADFRSKPFETVEAHVGVLANVLKESVFESLTYLSSTRVYIKSKTDRQVFTEEDDISINSTDRNDIFGASKITGELLALNSGRPNIKIVRLSNVYGADLFSQNFLTAVINEALAQKKVKLFTTPDSAKDYISIDDVCDVLQQVAVLPKTGIYNLACGTNTSNGSILEIVKQETGAEIEYAENAKTIIFKPIDTSKIREELKWMPKGNVIEALPGIISMFKNRR